MELLLWRAAGREAAPGGADLGSARSTGNGTRRQRAARARHTRRTGNAGAGRARRASRAQPALTREAALAESPRLQVETARVFGSIALTGARIDDISLKNYRETVDPKSPHIVLLSPQTAPKPYYADFGWVSASGLATPTAQTVWTASASKLTPAAPVTLSWDNGQGLVFRRIVSIDDNAMFTIRDEVENKGTQAATCSPMASSRATASLPRSASMCCMKA